MNKIHKLTHDTFNMPLHPSVWNKQPVSGMKRPNLLASTFTGMHR